MYVTYGGTNLSALNGLTGTSTITGYTRGYIGNPLGGADTVRVSGRISGTICLLQGTSYTKEQAQTAIDGAVNALQTAVATQGLALAFKRDSGTDANLSFPAGSLGGVQISNLVLPNDQTVDYASGLSWSFDVEAYYSDPNYADLYDLKQSVQTSGGGPEYAWTIPVTGTPTRWTVADQTVGTLVQSGTIVGRDSYLVLPAKIGGLTYYVENKSDEGVTSPLSRPDGSLYGYARNYRFVFEKAGPWDILALGL